MYHSYKHLVRSCCPLTIVDDDQHYWGKIGGFPPHGVEPAVITESTRYFATLKTGLAEQTELSLFISMVSGQTSPNSFSKNAFQMHSAENPLVQFVFHKPSPRGKDQKLVSELSGNGLIIEAERLDSDDPDENIIWNHHKIGGYPFFARNFCSIVQQSKALLEEGYLHLAQLCFPDKQDALVHGSWPFRGFVFHVFAKEVGGKIDFRYCWS